uniref:L-Fucosyltransferase n=1 Tax=Haemonchus contortus TaxID=6289 RepID=A0A7I4XXB5_HAECO
MHQKWRRQYQYLIILLLFAVILIQLYSMAFTVKVHGRYVAIESNGGRIGNQLLHLCSGHGIARKIGRRQYIRTLNSQGFYIGKHLAKIEEIFPRFVEVFTVMNVWNEHRVPFAQSQGRMSCCEYEDPSRLKDRSEQFLVLEFHYAQNVRYFEYMLPELRQLLEFSMNIQHQGDKVLRRWKLNNATAMCAHIRRSDFVELEVATDLHKSIRDMESIALQQGLSDYLIFGDDVDFMRRMVEALRIKMREGSRAFFSTNTEGIDFYVASRACGAMLITAPTSTFGWWLAFFTPNQNAVFYSNDRRRMADKVPQKDLFLSTWRPY